MAFPKIQLNWLLLILSVVALIWAIWARMSQKEDPVVEAPPPEPKIEWVRRGNQFVNKKTDEPFEGLFVKNFDASSLIEWESNYVDGIRQGASIEYYPTPSKRIKARYNYVDGVRQGPQVTYHFNGLKESEGTAVDGYITGLVSFFAPDGLIDHRDVYRRGSPTSTPPITVEPELVRAPEAIHDESAIDLIDPERPVMLEGETPFTGTQVGTFHGGAKAFEHRYVDGREEGMHQGWSPAGDPEYERPYLDRKKHGTWRAWGDGKAQLSEEHFHHGHQIGTAKHHYPNGHPRMISQFVLGAEHGTRQEFGPDGAKKRALVFEHGVIVREKKWDRAGQVSMDVPIPMIEGVAVSFPPGEEKTETVEIPNVPDGIEGEITINFRYRLSTDDKKLPPPGAARPFTITLLHDGEPREFNEIEGTLGGGWQLEAWAVSIEEGEKLTLEIKVSASDLQLDFDGITYFEDIGLTQPGGGAAVEEEEP